MSRGESAMSDRQPVRAAASPATGAAPERVELFRSTGYLRLLGPTARTIFDVGVSNGTEILYRAFRDREFVLIDPHRGGEDLLEYRPRRYRFVQKGLGSAPGRLLLNDATAQSSFLTRTALSAVAGEVSYKVEVVTLDSLVAELAPAPPFGIKIDTEGFELEVIRGMEQTLRDTEFVICEANIRNLFEGGYRFSDLVCHMKLHGFEFFNFLNKPKNRPRFYDVVFLRRDNPLFD
jgi:FkbM family methyltransferase